MQPMSEERPDGRPGHAEPFIPDGAESEAWLGYVDRVRERRFRALVAAIDAALIEGDAPAARIALAEAHELKPGAPELADRAERVAALVEPGAPVEAGTASPEWFDEPMRREGELTATAPDPSQSRSSHRGSSDSRRFGRAVAVAAAVIGVIAVILLVMPWLWRPEPAAIIVVAPPPADVPVGTTARVEPPPAATGQPAPVPPAPVPPGPAERPSPVLPAVPERVQGGGVPNSDPDAGADVAARLAVRRVIDWYAASYSRLDARAVAAIEQGTDSAALERAFAALDRQDLNFRRCDIDVVASRATARCVGELRYVPRSGTPGSTLVRWDFTMAETSGGWVIEEVVRR
jgi:hypothetical protein